MGSFMVATSQAKAVTYMSRSMKSKRRQENNTATIRYPSTKKTTEKTTMIPTMTDQ
jgi:hypothetical protein